MGTLQVGRSLLQLVDWFLVGVVVVPTLAVACLFVPFHTLVAYKLGLVEVVIVASPLVGFCTWV